MNDNLDNFKWQRFDTQWVIGLFGTAVGAGILFLPMKAGIGGVFPLFLMILIALPMTYLSHRGLSRFVMSTSKNEDITNALEGSFGNVLGNIITLLYFLAIYPICLIYGVGITNTINSFLVNQLGIVDIPRWIIAIVSITFMMLVMVNGMKFMLKVTSWLVYPLLISLLFFSLYLIPNWRLDAFSLMEMPSIADTSILLWATIPVLVFAFNHSPAISAFSVDVKKHYKKDDLSAHKASRILFFTALVITLFTMFFVFSCVLTLTKAQIIEAKSQNIPILSYFANINGGNKLLSYLGPLIAFTAIVSSFFGHYLGASEGLHKILQKQTKVLKKEVNDKTINYFVVAFMYISMIIVAIINPSILGVIETLGGPVIATILFLMPLYAIYKVPAMKKYANDKFSNLFVFVIGVIAMSGIVYGLFNL